MCVLIVLDWFTRTVEEKNYWRGVAIEKNEAIRIEKEEAKGRGSSYRAEVFFWGMKLVFIEFGEL